MGLLKIVFGIAGALVLIVIGLGAYLYFTDYEAQATVTDTGGGAGGTGPYAVITPNIAPFYDYKATLDAQSSKFVCKGYVVKFRLQTQSYRVFDREGDLVVDSTRSPSFVLTRDLVQCASALPGTEVQDLFGKVHHL